MNRNDGSLYDQEPERVLASYASQAATVVHQYQYDDERVNFLSALVRSANRPKLSSN